MSRPSPAALPQPPSAPPYGRSALSDLLPSLLAALDIPDEPNVLGIEPVSRACLLLIDGLGWELLREHAEAAPFLASLMPAGRVLGVGFPATTATSLASVGTGLPPGGHGMLGYQVRVPGEERLLNALHWDGAVDPRTWQPEPTAFQRAAAEGVAVTQVAPGRLRDSGLTHAALRGARFTPAEAAGERVARSIEALAADERSVVYTYYGDLDATGHRNGCRSDAWLFQLGHVDRLAEQLATGLPPGAALIVTADHGMVDAGPDDRIDIDADPVLDDGVLLLGGEARARHVYARPGAAADVLAAWRERLAGRAWVLSRDEAVAAGWFGPEVADRILPRIGDVVVAACGHTALIARRREPVESSLVGLHGSLGDAEQLVPLFDVRR
jgi:hypothetical protein